MMLFTPENARLILEGRKTQTRRLVSGDELLIHPRYPAVYAADERLRWEVGRTYAVQPGRTKAAIGRIRITAIRREWLQDIEPEDIREEGINRADLGDFTPLDIGAPDEYDAFISLWDSINHKPGTRWADNPSVWVLTFEVVK